MSLNVGLIALEGNHLGELLEFFGDAGYRLGGVEWLSTDDTAKFLDAAKPDEIVKAVYFDTHWTVIIDPELVIATNACALSTYARDNACRICACVCADTGGAYSFALYAASGQTLRAIDVSGGVITHNIGEPLKGEPDPLCLDETTTIALFTKIASRYEYFEVEREYTVYTLVDKERELASLLKKAAKKPWWKFW